MNKKIETITHYLSDDVDITIGLNGNFIIDDGSDQVALTLSEIRELVSFLKEVLQ